MCVLGVDPSNARFEAARPTRSVMEGFPREWRIRLSRTAQKRARTPWLALSSASEGSVKIQEAM
jgi:hypothetical protein